jgi:hypothetical protein
VEIWTQSLLPWLCAAGAIGFAVSNVGFLAQGLKEQEVLCCPRTQRAICVCTLARGESPMRWLLLSRAH